LTLEAYTKYLHRENQIMPSFSERRGITSEEPPITVRNDAPDVLRTALWGFALQAGLPETELGELILDLVPFPDFDENRAITSMGYEALQACEWPRVYDLAEAISEDLWELDGAADQTFARFLNEFFRKHSIGWQLVNRKIEVRGQEALETTVRDSIGALEKAGHRTASNELHEALRHLSRRP
jgi:hypothetical protein